MKKSKLKLDQGRGGGCKASPAELRVIIFCFRSFGSPKDATESEKIVFFKGKDKSY